VLTSGCSDLVEGALDVVLEGRAEQVTDDAELEPVSTAFAVKYPTGPWDFVVRDGACSDRDAGERGVPRRPDIQGLLVGLATLGKRWRDFDVHVIVDNDYRITHFPAMRNAPA